MHSNRCPISIHHTPYSYTIHYNRCPISIHHAPYTIHHTPYTILIHYALQQVTLYTIPHTLYTVLIERALQQVTPYTIHHTLYTILIHYALQQAAGHVTGSSGVHGVAGGPAGVQEQDERGAAALNRAHGVQSGGEERS
jgi:hypothetical protein